MENERLTDQELATLAAAGYELTGEDGGPDGIIWFTFSQGEQEARSTVAEWRHVIAGLNRPPEEDEAVFGKDAWVYCRQHLRPHQTGWCGVSPRDKVALGVTDADAAYRKCKDWGFELYKG